MVVFVVVVVVVIVVVVKVNVVVDVVSTTQTSELLCVAFSPHEFSESLYERQTRVELQFESEVHVLQTPQLLLAPQSVTFKVVVVAVDVVTVVVVTVDGKVDWAGHSLVGSSNSTLLPQEAHWFASWQSSSCAVAAHTNLFL